MASVNFRQILYLFSLSVTHTHTQMWWSWSVAYAGILFGGVGSTISVEDRENRDLGAVEP